MKMYLPLTFLLLSFLSVNPIQAQQNLEPAEFWVSKFLNYRVGSYTEAGGEFSGLSIFTFELQYYNPNQEPVTIREHTRYYPHWRIEFAISFVNTAVINYQFQHFVVGTAYTATDYILKPGITNATVEAYITISKVGSSSQDSVTFLPDGNYTANYRWYNADKGGTSGTSYPLIFRVVSGEISEDKSAPAWQGKSTPTSQITSSENQLLILTSIALVPFILGVGILSLIKRKKRQI